MREKVILGAPNLWVLINTNPSTIPNGPFQPVANHIENFKHGLPNNKNIPWDLSLIRNHFSSKMGDTYLLITNKDQRPSYLLISTKEIEWPL